MVNEIINVSIICDHALFAGLLANYLQGQVNIRVVCHVTQSDGLSIPEMPVEVTIIGAVCSERFGLEVLAKLKRSSPQSRCILISVSTDEKYISSALEYGIYGYMSPLEPIEAVMRAIQLSAQDKVFPTSLLTKGMYFNRKSKMRSASRLCLQQLTERDKRVLQLLWEEKNNKEIAAELFVGIRSVEKIRQNLKRKLGAKSTIGMLKYILE